MWPLKGDVCACSAEGPFESPPIIFSYERRSRGLRFREVNPPAEGHCSINENLSGDLELWMYGGEWQEIDKPVGANWLWATIHDDLRRGQHWVTFYCIDNEHRLAPRDCECWTIRGWVSLAGPRVADKRTPLQCPTSVSAASSCAKCTQKSVSNSFWFLLRVSPKGGDH